ncbi:MAG: CHAD domain-containing protein [Longimicrobiales bacterium]
MRIERRHLRQLPDAPARRGIRLVALFLLQQAEAAFSRLCTSTDPKALHDFRVSLRRLRSHARSYRPWLRESVDKKHAQQLRRISRASNPSRDFEVLMERLDELTFEEDLEVAGSTMLHQRFLEQMLGAVEEFRGEALQEFPALSRELRLGLSSYLERLQIEDGPTERLGPVASRLCGQLREELRNTLGAVFTIEHQQQAHEARIVGKKLRYLLEPFAPQIRACADAVQALKTLQDDFGHLHDVHVLMTEAESALRDADVQAQVPLAAVLQRVRDWRGVLFAEVRRQYIESKAALLLDGVRTAERELMRAARSREIERKFLLTRFPRLRNAQQLNIQQGYLPGSDIRERVRSIESNDGRTFYRTLKAGRGLTRLEIEETIDEHVFKGLFALTKGQRVRKRRYIVEENGLRWEIDRFLDRKLVLAEVELESEDQVIELPRWLKPLVEREVTDDPEFSNEKLAR